MAKDDLDRMAKRDIKRFKKVKDTGMPGTGTLLENVLWTLLCLTAVGMIVVMPWVGEGKPLSGGMWLGTSLILLIMFGGLAFIVRQIPD